MRLFDFERAPNPRRVLPGPVPYPQVPELVAKDGGFLIDRISLSLKAKVPGLEEQRFQELARVAKEGCPLSKALAGVPRIGLKAELMEA